MSVTIRNFGLVFGIMLLALYSTFAFAAQDQIQKDMIRIIADMPNGQFLPLDMSKPHHKRVYYDSLLKSGMTAETAPQFFRELKKLEALHQNTPPKPHPMTLVSPGHTNVIPIDMVSGLDYDTNSSNLKVSAYSSYPNGTQKTSITLLFFNNKTQKFIGTPKTLNQFAGGTDFGGDNLVNLTEIPDEGITAYATIFVATGSGEQYGLGANTPSHTYHAAMTQYKPFTVETIWASPIQKLPHNGKSKIEICWQTRGGQDCDYTEQDSSGGYQDIFFDMKGSFQFSGGKDGGAITERSSTNSSSTIAISRSDGGGV